MNTSLEPGTCNWHDRRECQFPEYALMLTEFNGRQYCPLHLPRDAKNARIDRTVAADLPRHLKDGIGNMNGVWFPQGEYRLVRRKTWHFEDAHFASVTFEVEHSDSRDSISFAGSSFDGSFFLRIGQLRKVIANRCNFVGDVDIVGEEGDVAIMSFSHSTFRGHFDFKVRRVSETLYFEHCVFRNAAPRLLIERLPQRTSFANAVFHRDAISSPEEAEYRIIRNLFHLNRARDEEARFYALEKRCQREALLEERRREKGETWASLFRKVRACTSIIVSAAYDRLSSYGQSFERAMMWFMLLQISAAWYYSWYSERFVPFGRIDSQIVVFTFAQVLRPFELWSTRPSAHWVHAIVGTNPSPGWLVATMLHSILSLVLIAMIVLAIRWRFRRE